MIVASTSVNQLYQAKLFAFGRNKLMVDLVDLVDFFFLAAGLNFHPDSTYCTVFLFFCRFFFDFFSMQLTTTIY